MKFLACKISAPKERHYGKEGTFNIDELLTLLLIDLNHWWSFLVISPFQMLITFNKKLLPVNSIQHVCFYYTGTKLISWTKPWMALLRNFWVQKIHRVEENWKPWRCMKWNFENNNTCIPVLTCRTNLLKCHQWNLTVHFVIKKPQENTIIDEIFFTVLTFVIKRNGYY